MTNLGFKKGTKVALLTSIPYAGVDMIDTHDYYKMLSDGLEVEDGNLFIPKGKIMIYEGIAENGYDTFTIGSRTYDLIINRDFILELK